MGPKSRKIVEEIATEIVQTEVNGMFDALVDQIEERDKALQSVIDKAVINALHRYLGVRNAVAMELGVLS